MMAEGFLVIWVVEVIAEDFFSDLGSGDLGGAFNRTSLGLKPLVVNWDVC